MVITDYFKKIQEIENAMKSFAMRNNQGCIWQNIWNQGQSFCDPNAMDIDAVYNQGVVALTVAKLTLPKTKRSQRKNALNANSLIESIVAGAAEITISTRINQGIWMNWCWM